MKIRSLSNYKQPSYPTREMYILRPMLLNDCSPPSWGKKAMVTGALMAFIMAGCARTDMEVNPQKAKSVQMSPVENPAVEKTGKTHSLQQVGEKNQTASRKQAQKQKVKIAPIFVHGDGTGGVGCVAVSPPVFINEADAKRIIEDELKKSGIEIDRRKYRVDGVQIKKVHRFLDEEEARKHQANILNNIKDHIPVEMDGYNSKYNLGYEYVSTKDYDKIVVTHYMSTARGWNTKGIAEKVQDTLEKNDKINAVVFYEPLNSPDWSKYNNVTDDISKQMDMADRDALKETESLLRQQVQDFIRWAKAEGVLQQAGGKKGN